jgi:catechol 2,3-dioxygenase-like lactoylglutathione lyase family enzyme
VTRDVPCPELDHVPIRIGDVHRSAVVVQPEVVHLGLLSVLAEPLHRVVERFGRHVHRVVNVHAASTAGQADLRPPEADARTVAGHDPDGIAILPALDDGKAEHVGIEPLGCREVDDLEHELVDAGDRDPAHPTFTVPARGRLAAVIEGLDHVQIAAPAGCEAEARRFFGALLGLRELPKPEQLAARGGAWFQVGAQELHVGVASEFEPARKAHPALRVGNVDELAARLAAAGVEARWDEELPGIRRFYADDPWGNRLEFLQRK